MSLITETAQIKQAIELINTLDNAKFNGILQRIIQNVHTSYESYFTDDELIKLEVSLELTRDNIIIVINIIEFILLQSVYELVKASFLVNELQNLRLNEEKSLIFGTLWKEHGKEMIERIKQSKTITHNRLEDIKWRLSIQLASDLKTKQKLSNALVNFSIKGEKNEDFLVEFTKEELFEFYANLELIQKQIDALN
jgi:COMM domain containing 10